ncbi:MAG TPA: asparagine synthetase B [Candidatus Bathyarchaeia archaeon]|nr:asparagine synthetase B [Candidatus Bathyarchaeia archaeon]
MTALAAVYTNETHDGEELVRIMLSAMQHRGRESGIVRNEENPNITLGLAGTLNQQGILESDQGTVALDGTFFKHGKKGSAYTALQQSLKGFTSITAIPGAFSLLYAHKNRLQAIRDPNGLRPLYYSHNNSLTIIASERKALWRIGERQVERILPGHLYTVTKQQLAKKSLFKLQRPVEKRMTMEHASTTLKRLLIKSTQLITNDVKRVAVAFSGGLDSAITALLAKRRNLDVELISTGLTGSQELRTVEKFAQELNLPISIQTYEPDILEQYVRRILWLIEEPDLMKVSIAIPLHWAATLASRRGHSVLLCGQGSDELYGGYSRYARILDTEGPRALTTELYRSLVQSPQVNYERDEQATNPTGIELRTPFANLDVIHFSLQIPLKFKVKKGNDIIRKWVLRETARKTGLPENLVSRRKKAIQHGTGVENAIKKLARAQQLTPDAYLWKVYEPLRDQEAMP